MRRRAVVELVTGNLINEHCTDRNYLAHTTACSAILATAGCDFSLLIR
jgi:hypothetical protein